MGPGALDQMVRASRIPRDTLIAYRNGRRTPPPDKVEVLYRAASALGASVEQFRIEGNGIRVVAMTIPELNRQVQWAGLDGWVNDPRPHESYRTPRFDIRSLAGIGKWPDLDQLIATSPDSIAVATFPSAARWDDSTGVSWSCAILDLKRYHRDLSGEFVVARLRQERAVPGAPAKIAPNDLILCQQIRYAPRLKTERRFRVVPAWPWPTSRSGSCFEFEPFVVKLEVLEALYHGNLRAAT